MVAESLHGLRSPLHVLLRARLRAARRSPSDDRYGRSIRVKVNVRRVLARELARRSWKRESVAVGAATDPTAGEGRYRLTRAAWRCVGGAQPVQHRHARADDRARHRRAADGGGARGRARELLVPTLDREVWRRTEPGTAPPRQRLRALQRCS
jgi:hypothetical protein